MYQKSLSLCALLWLTTRGIHKHDMRPRLVESLVYKYVQHNLWELVVLPAGKSFMIGLDAGTAVSSDGSRLDGGQPRGRRGGGPGGGDPP